VVETFNFDYPNGFGAYPKPDYSHNTQVINIAIENQLASYDIEYAFGRQAKNLSLKIVPFPMLKKQIFS
jgi:hypothetical protein